MELKPTSALEPGADGVSKKARYCKNEACGEDITKPSKHSLSSSVQREYYSCSVDGEDYHRDCVPVKKENMLFVTCGRDIKYGKVTPGTHKLVKDDEGKFTNKDQSVTFYAPAFELEADAEVCEVLSTEEKNHY
jgi:hypothetical protein